MENQRLSTCKCSPNLFTDEECERIKREALLEGFEYSTVIKNGKPVKSIGRTNASAWLKRNPGREWIYEKMFSAALEVNREMWGFDIDNIANIGILRYKPFQFFYWHYDVYPGSRRKITAVVNLSSSGEYRFGGLAVRGDVDDKAHVRKQGSAIWFPSFLHHMARPPLWGERWVLVAWFEGPPLR